jgi:trigger factor
LKIETQPLVDHQIKLTVEIDSEELDEAKRRAARRLASKIKIPGFRPGKAPLPVIVRTVGEAAIFEEALEHWVDDNYPKIIEQSGIKPYGPGKLETVASMEPAVLEFVVPLEATVTLGDYRSIRRDYQPRKITDDDVNEVLESLRGRLAVQEPVSRPVQEGDIVTVKFHGERFEAGADPETTEIPERSNQVLVRTSQDASRYEWPFPGFSQELIGLSVGDQKELIHTYSDDYELESLRGVRVTYQAAIEDIKERHLPEINDEFAAQVGDYDTLAALTTEIRSGLEQRALQEYNDEYDTAILKELVDISTFEYPPQMVEDERRNVINSFVHRLEEQGSSLDLYLKTRQMDQNAFEAEVTPTAEQRLKQSLALVELAQLEDIQVDPAEAESETIRTVEELSQSLSAKEARKLSSERVLTNVFSSVMVDLLTRRSVERLRAIASGEADKPEEELLDAQQAEELAQAAENVETAESADTSETI